MTTLYKPVLIETTEQAAALPVGTVAEIRDEDGWHDVAAKVGHNDWRTAAADSGMDWPDGYVVGWTAFVPIEVEEEYAVRLGSEGGMILPIGTSDPAPGHGGVDNQPRMTRHVTPWIPKEQA